MALRDRPFDDEDLQPGDVITRSRLGLNKQAQNRRSNPNIQPETPTERPSNPGRRTLSGRHNPNMHPLDERGASNVELTEADIEDLQRDASLVDGPQGLRRQVTSHGGRRQVRQFDNGGVAVVGSETGNFNKGGTVRTIPAARFVNPVPARFSARDQGRFGEREFAKRQAEFNRKATRDAAIESDLEFRRNLRERRLLDDANLNLSGDMTLGELASRAARRRSARATLSQRDANQAELAQAQAELAQEAQIEAAKEQGRNARKEADLFFKATKEDNGANRERANAFFDLKFSELNSEGEEIFDPQARARAEQLVASEGKKISQLNNAQLDKVGDFAQAILNFERETEIAVDSLAEFANMLGYIDRELFESFDNPEIILIDKKGNKIKEADLYAITGGDPQITRLVKEAILNNVRHGRVPFVEKNVGAALGQEVHEEYEAISDREANLRRRKAKAEAKAEKQRLRNEARRISLGDRDVTGVTNL